MKQEIEITEAKIQDLDQIEQLYECSIKNNKQGFIQDLNFHPNIKDQTIAFQKNNGAMFVVKKENKVIGMGGLKCEDKTRVTLCKIHLKTEEQGNGYGRALVEKLLGKAYDLGYKKVILDVTKSQKNAIATYKKLGFKIYDDKVFDVNVAGRIEQYDCLLMEYEL